MSQEKRELQKKVDQLNRLQAKIFRIKETNPELRCGYYISAPSLLNAYREGDISFEACVELLRGLEQRAHAIGVTEGRAWQAMLELEGRERFLRSLLPREISEKLQAG